MAPSGRVPRVPRVPRAPRASGSVGREETAAAEARLRAAEGDVTQAAHDDAPSPTGGRVTVRSSAKVTLLSPAQTGGTVEAGDDAKATGGRSRLPGLPLIRRASAAGAQDGAPAGHTQAPGESDSAEVLAFPEPPRKRRRRRLLVGALIAGALVAGLFAVVLFTPLIAVRTISIQGTHLLTSQQVEAALAPVRGRPLATVGGDEVRGLLGPLVQVRTAKVRAVPPETLVVQIVERVPVAVVKQDKRLLVVDGDGVVLGEAGDTSQYAVPVIDGSAMPVGGPVFHAVTAVLAALPPDILGQLSTATGQSADSVELRLADGRTVVWGNADERELKAKVLEALMKAAENPEKGQAPARVFDVSTPRHPVTR